MHTIPDISILRKHYIDDDLSIRQICAIYCISYEAVQRRLHQSGIKKSKSAIRAKINERIKDTSRIKYGTDHHMQSHQGYLQYRNALHEHYGITNIMQSRQTQEHYAATCLSKYGVNHSLKSGVVRNKAHQTCIERYGVDNPFKSRTLMANALMNRKTTNAYFGGGDWAITRWGKIFIRSSYEASLLKLLDEHPLVASLAYESIKIAYDQSTYIPDFLVNGRIILEVKPKRFIYPLISDNAFVHTIAEKNRIKHTAAIHWAHANKYKYYLITERQLNIRYISTILACHHIEDHVL